MLYGGGIMKKVTIAIVFALVFATIFLVSCGTTSTFKGVRRGVFENMAGYSINVTCDFADGTGTYTITTEEEHSKNIHCDVTAYSGYVKVTIQDDKGTEYLNKELNGKDSYVDDVELGDYGKYIITMVFDDYGGTYSFDWE